MKEGSVAAPKIRRAAFEAFLCSWTQACTYKNCTNGAMKTGTFPVSFEKVCENQFVKELTQEEDMRRQRNANSERLNINSKLITTPAVINEINDDIKRFDRFSYLCLQQYQGSYQNVAQRIVNEEHSGCRMLSKLPPFITNTDIE